MGKFWHYFWQGSAALRVTTVARGSPDNSGPQCDHWPCPGDLGVLSFQSGQKLHLGPLQL